MLTGKENRAARCGASGKRFDADCRHDRPSLRAADWCEMTLRIGECGTN